MNKFYNEMSHEINCSKNENNKILISLCLGVFLRRKINKIFIYFHCKIGKHSIFLRNNNIRHFLPVLISTIV